MFEGKGGRRGERGHSCFLWFLCSICVSSSAIFIADTYFFFFIGNQFFAHKKEDTRIKRKTHLLEEDKNNNPGLDGTSDSFKFCFWFIFCAELQEQENQTLF